MLAPQSDIRFIHILLMVKSVIAHRFAHPRVESACRLGCGWIVRDLGFHSFQLDMFIKPDCTMSP